MVGLSRAATFAAALTAVALMATSSDAQERGPGEAAYFRAVALYFDLPESEIGILGDWDLPSDEIPVVLFVARRSGVSAEALVALRESGHSWVQLARRYGIGAAALHVPLPNPRAAGALAPLYESFQGTPQSRWSEIRLEDANIVALVNIRVLSGALGLDPAVIAGRTAGTTSFVDLYAQLVR